MMIVQLAKLSPNTITSADQVEVKEGARIGWKIWTKKGSPFTLTAGSTNQYSTKEINTVLQCAARNHAIHNDYIAYRSERLTVRQSEEYQEAQLVVFMFDTKEDIPEKTKLLTEQKNWCQHLPANRK